VSSFRYDSSFQAFFQSWRESRREAARHNPLRIFSWARSPHKAQAASRFPSRHRPDRNSAAQRCRDVLSMVEDADRIAGFADHRTEGITLMPQTKLILRNYVALAVLTVAVIAMEFLPTSASAQSSACVARCWCYYCGCSSTVCPGAQLPLFYACRQQCKTSRGNRVRKSSCLVVSNKSD
jgi:hypothetical protein